MKNIYKRYALPMLLNIHICSVLCAQDFQVLDINKIKDANPLNNYWSGYYDGGYGKFEYALLNGVIYFSANDGIHGTEFWRSDGTDAGTKLIKDIYPGEAPSEVHNITVSNGKLFFAANDGVHGLEIWISDGTSGGTRMLKDIYAGLGSSSPSFLVDANGTLYFFTNYASVADQLWKTDGTKEGTQRVANFYTSKFGYNSNANQLTNVNGHLFFVLRGNGDQELYTSDGTNDGTKLVKDINPFGTSYPYSLTAMKGLLYFSADDGSGRRLWVSDGSDAGTYAVNNINNIYLNNDPFNNELNQFVIKGNKLFFSGYSNDNDGSELCSYDVSDASNSPKVVKDFAPGSPSHNLYNLVNVNGTIFFTVYAGTNGGQALWKSDGTPAGTVLVKNINPGGRNIYWYKEFKNCNGTLLFSFYDEIHGTELWKSDGTQAGTARIKEMAPGALSANVTCITYAGNNTSFFGATDSKSGQELWKTDGTKEGTVLVKNINGKTNPSSSPSLLTPSFDNTKLLFTAANNNVGNELWISDGSSEGTTLLKDVIPGSSSSNPYNLVSTKHFSCFVARIIDSTVPNTSDEFYTTRFFSTNGTRQGTSLIEVPHLDSMFNNQNGSVSYISASNNLVYLLAFNYITYKYELWRSDGTTAGTYLLKPDIDPNYFPSPYIVGNTVFFVNYDFTSGLELWKTDGTIAGTYLLKSGISTDYFSTTISLGNILFFLNYDDMHGTEIWRSDATVAGTRLLKDIAAGPNSSFPSNLYVFNNDIYFNAFNGSFQQALWRSDGTSSGTKPVKKNVYVYTMLGVADGKLFFYADATAKGSELWATDGTSAGTRLVRDINPGANSSGLFNSLGVDSLIYFMAVEPVHGYELWRSDGTASGTKMLKDMTPGAGSSNIYSLVNGNGRLYFINSDVLWTSDGTSQGTVPVNDECLKNVSNLNNLILVDGKLFFAAFSPEKGQELFAGDVNGFTVASADEDMFKTAIKSSISVYPNPAKNILNISTGAKSIISLTDQSGKMILTKSVEGTASIDVSNLSAGVYYLKNMTTGEMQKIVVAK